MNPSKRELHSIQAEIASTALFRPARLLRQVHNLSQIFSLPSFLPWTSKGPLLHRSQTHRLKYDVYLKMSERPFFAVGESPRTRCESSKGEKWSGATHRPNARRGGILGLAGIQTGVFSLSHIRKAVVPNTANVNRPDACLVLDSRPSSAFVVPFIGSGRQQAPLEGHSTASWCSCCRSRVGRLPLWQLLTRALSTHVAGPTPAVLLASVGASWTEHETAPLGVGLGTV